MRILIIGNSATAVGAIESIRRYDQSAQITVVSEEPHLIYSRPMLSHLLGGEIGEPQVAYRGSDFYQRYHVEPALSTRITAIHPREHSILAEDGRRFAYDKLLICTGGTPIVPPVPGADAEGVFSFTRLDDALAIDRYLSTGSVRRAIVVGGGMIGIKATDALMKRQVPMDMVELAPRILGAALDETASALLTNLLTQAGVGIHTGNTITAIHQEVGKIVAVTLQDGSELACDLLVFGVGVRPNAALAQEAGLQVNRGIVVDVHMRTSAQDIYAAGDVAEAYDLVVDMNRTVAIWPNAYRQGAIAGAHMAGVPRADTGGIAMNTVEVCGVPAMSIGNGNATGDEYQIQSDLNERKREYRRLVLKEGRLVGAILVGNIDRAGIYTGLIRLKLDVSSYADRLMDARIGLLSVPDEYRKHIVTGSGIEV